MKKAFPILEDCVHQQFSQANLFARGGVFLSSVIYVKWQGLKHLCLDSLPMKITYMLRMKVLICRL